MKPPKKIYFLSDNSEAELVLKPSSLKPKSGEEYAFYKFTKSELPEFIGMEFPMYLKAIQQLFEVKKIHYEQ